MQLMQSVVPQQLELEVAAVEPLPEPSATTRRRAHMTSLDARLALSPEEAAGVLGVSRDYFDEHILLELRVVRRGRRILVAMAELQRWLEHSAARTVEPRR